MDIMMLIQLFGGLGLFLYGMDLMGEGLKKAAGNKLKDILNKVTSNPIKALALGTIVTMIIQSSSATTVLVVGLVNANLMTLAQAAGVILGADIGTTITGQIIALNLSDYAPLFIGIGAAILMFANKDKLKHVAECILGFGILFFGISVMSTVLKPLADNPFFTNMLVSLGHYPILGLLAGVFVTAVIQSSSASIGLLQALAIGGAFAGVEGYEALGVVVPIVLGMNIGTCATAMIAMIGVEREAKQAAVFHLITKTVGVIWMMSLLFLTGAFAKDGHSFVFNFILSISGSDPTQQIANFHTMFNVINASLLLFLSKPLIKFIEKVLPVKKKDEESDFTLKLNDILLENPAFAVSEALNEVETMSEIAYKSVNLASNACINNEFENIEEVELLENLINKYETGIAEFVIKISALDASIQSADFTVHLHQV
ncbi:Na/Pi cotransporter family protein, partial [Anaerofustis stercorihominis]